MIILSAVLASPLALLHADDASWTRRHRAAVANNPPGVQFVLELADGRKRFRVGETITVHFHFSSRIPEKYILNSAGYDRSGRLHLDQYHVQPDHHVVDPLRGYFGSGVVSNSMGGVRSVPVLTAEPYTLTFEPKNGS